MSVLSIVMALSIGLIQSASAPINSITETANLTFAKDFKQIESLGQMKDSAGLEIMAADLKARWKDSDMDRYCRLMHELLGCLRTDFDPVDYAKLKVLSDDVLSDLEKIIGQEVNPVLVPRYFEFQASYIGTTYGSKYSVHTIKGDTKDEAWVHQRMDVMTRLLKVWKLLQDAKDPTWNINLKMPSMNVDPHDGGPSGGSPDAIVDPELRAQYVAEIKRVAAKHKWWGIQYELWKTEDRLKRRLQESIAMYNTPPLAPDELKSLLDTYVKDEEQKKMFLGASQR